MCKLEEQSVILHGHTRPRLYNKSHPQSCPDKIGFILLQTRVQWRRKGPGSPSESSSSYYNASCWATDECQHTVINLCTESLHTQKSRKSLNSWFHSNTTHRKYRVQIVAWCTIGWADTLLKNPPTANNGLEEKEPVLSFYSSSSIDWMISPLGAEKYSALASCLNCSQTRFHTGSR